MTEPKLPEHPIVERIVERAAAIVADRILAQVFDLALPGNGGAPEPKRARTRSVKGNGGAATFPCRDPACARVLSSAAARGRHEKAHRDEGKP
jgi:hypothetical protein